MRQDAPKKEERAKPQTNSIKALVKRSPWLFGAGVAIVICLLLTLIPGGQAMPVLAFWIAGWTFSIWLVRRYKIVRTLVIIAFVFITLVIIMFATLGPSLNSIQH